MKLPSLETVVAVAGLLGGLWKYLRHADTRDLKDRAESLVRSAVQHELAEFEHDPEGSDLGRARRRFTEHAESVLANAGIPLKLARQVIDSVVEEGIIALKGALARRARFGPPVETVHDLSTRLGTAFSAAGHYLPPDTRTSDNGASEARASDAAKAPPATLPSGT